MDSFLDPHNYLGPPGPFGTTGTYLGRPGFFWGPQDLFGTPWTYLDTRTHLGPPGLFGTPRTLDDLKMDF